VPAAWLDELAEWLRIPSVSADSAHAADVRAAGEWLCDFLARAGGTAEIVDWNGKPLALGSLGPAPGDGVPTVLLYGHFDVQPPAPLELWERPPFEPEVRGEWLYARGAADDKGQLYLLAKAAADLAAEGALPVHVRVAADGEEEIGGQSIVEFLQQDEQGADACVIFDTGMEARDLPSFNIATRGLVAFELAVRAGARDLHSGMYGNAAQNAIHALMQTLSAILPRDGRLPEPLREGIVPPSDEERDAWSQLPSGREKLEGAGAVAYDGRAANEFYARTWAEPSVDVNGIIGGKPRLRNTTISAEAEARFTIRLAPGQQPELIAAAAERLVREAAPNGVEVELRPEGATAPGLVDPRSPVIRLGLDAFERAVGKRPLLVRSGGTLPIMPALTEKGIPTILTGFALPESNVHSPNERILVAYLEQGLVAARELLVSLGRLQ
jgi:acetylornithine deacetylase/succinyl-diaminopimelate desuccinylase-like protein